VTAWWANTSRPDPQLTGPLENLVIAYLEEGADEGVRGDIAFCQAVKETGNFQYGGDVRPEQNNYCGLGATGGVPGLSFPDMRTGARAHIQHLVAYADANATEAGLTHPLVDPRFRFVTPKGKAPRWVDLNGKWAVPGVGYGESILSIYSSIS